MDPATVRRVAKLARIRLDDDQIPRVQADMAAILDWMAQLNEVDVDGVEPLTGAAQMALAMREDQVTDGGRAEAVLANAPGRAEDFFTVPKVVE